MYVYTQRHKYTHRHIHIPIYTGNFVCRDRTAFYLFIFFSKTYLNDVFCNNVNQFILTNLTHKEEVFL